MDRQWIALDWAWVGKNPGSRDDYGVLANSAEEIGGFAGQYDAGVPGSNTPANAAPPWVTFAAHTTTVSRALFSVSVRDPWQDQDQAGRPIWPRRFFACWFDDIAEAGASYRTLWDAVREVELPCRDRRPAEVEVERESVGNILATVNDIGFERLALIAAALLDGPVAVAGTANLRQDKRLAVLDAVAALLPYGFRAALSASSAVNSTLAHKIRLVLDEDSNHQLISLTGAPQKPRSEMAREYLNMLLDKAGGASPIPGRVVEYLWGERRACSFDRPDEALGILERLDREIYLIKSIDGTLKSSLRFFENPPPTVEGMWSKLEESKRPQLVQPLLDSEDPRAAEALLRNWDIVIGQVIALANRRLDEDDLRWAERGLLVAESSPRKERADRLLLKLLVPPPSTTEFWRQRIRSRVNLMRRRGVPAENTFEYTCDLLRYNQTADWQARLLLDLLVSEIAEDPSLSRTAGWASWLCLSAFNGKWDLPDWVLALRFTLTDTGDRAGEKVLSLVWQDLAWTAPLLRLAGRFQRLHAVLEATGLDLEFIDLAARVMTEPVQEDLRQLLASALDIQLWASDVAAGTIAAVDVARVLLGFSPRDFPTDAAERDFHLYNDGLGRVFGLQSARHFHSQIERGFLRHVMRGALAQPLSREAIWLLDSWSADESRARGLARYIASDPDAVKILLRDDRLNGAFWGPLVDLQPELSRFVIVPLLRGPVRQTIENPQVALQRHSVKQTGVSATKLALAMYDASVAGLPPVEILHVIQSVSVKDYSLSRCVPPRDLDDVLREFQALLYHPPFGDEHRPGPAERRGAHAEATVIAFWKLICAGALGEEYGRLFRQMLVERLRDEEKFRKAVRKMVRRPTSRRRGVFGRTRRGSARYPGTPIPEPKHAPESQQPRQLTAGPAPLHPVPGPVHPGAAPVNPGAAIVPVTQARPEASQSPAPSRWWSIRSWFRWVRPPRRNQKDAAEDQATGGPT